MKCQVDYILINVHFFPILSWILFLPLMTFDYFRAVFMGYVFFYRHYICLCNYNDTKKVLLMKAFIKINIFKKCWWILEKNRLVFLKKSCSKKINVYFHRDLAQTHTHTSTLTDRQTDGHIHTDLHTHTDTHTHLQIHRDTTSLA